MGGLVSAGPRGCADFWEEHLDRGVQPGTFLVPVLLVFVSFCRGSSAQGADSGPDVQVTEGR